jgi:hypothetical protein
MKLRGRHGAVRTDFGARWARSRGWITVYPGEPGQRGLTCFDEVASFTEQDWDAFLAWQPSAAELPAGWTKFKVGGA